VFGFIVFGLLWLGNRLGLSFGCACAVELVRVRFPAWAGWWAADQNEISSKFSKLKIKFQIYGTKFKPVALENSAFKF